MQSLVANRSLELIDSIVSSATTPSNQKRKDKAHRTKSHDSLAGRQFKRSLFLQLRFNCGKCVEHSLEYVKLKGVRHVESTEAAAPQRAEQ